MFESCASFKHATGKEKTHANWKDRRCKKTASGDDWEVQRILAFSTGKDGPRHLVRWKGFNEKHDTHEPEKNLRGSQELLAAFKKQRERDNEAVNEAAKGAAKEKHAAAGRSKTKNER